MRKVTMAALAAAGLGSAALFAVPAEAQPVQESAALAALRNDRLQTSYVQWRRGPYYGRPYYGRPYYGRPYYGRPYGYYYRRDNWGNAAAAGALGLATGAIIGGAIAQQQQAPVYAAPNQSAVAYCARRFKSYDPASGTYLGYDGLRHSCP